MLRSILTTATLLCAALTGSPAVDVPAAHAAQCAITSTLQLGSRSGQVACLEARLSELGFGTGSAPDPSFGLSTRARVVAFQTSRGLGVDGLVGPLTRAALDLHRPPAATVAPVIVEQRVISTSVQGRPILATRMGTPGGRIVLVVGIIHGDEVKGGEVTALLATLATPVGIDLWLIDTINPDGVANGTRGNANAVDLNRNFSNGWSYIAPSSEHRQYSGEAPADQPETAATEAFIREIQPEVAIWYHQDANTVSAGGARTEIPTEYAALVGLSISDVPCSQRCTGTAGSFINSTVAGATSFLVELPGSAAVTPDMIRIHAEAALTVMSH
ncbi:MAG: DUF2817 domain-containing protein [Ilumatobacteraceae bacterium]